MSKASRAVLTGDIIGLGERRGASADFAVVIRSLWLTEGVRPTCAPGGKIVAESDVSAEYAEARAKATFLIQAVDKAERLRARSTGYIR